MEPRYLYHGTVERHHSSIMQNGIQPPRVTGINNWEKGRDRSYKKAVYLTSSYPTVYAQNAMGTSEETANERYVIYEIDTDRLPWESSLCACEDVLRLWMWDSVKTLPVQSAVEFTSANFHGAMLAVSAERSIEALGQCAIIGSVPTRCIVSALFLDQAAMVALVMNGLDPVMTLKSFSLFGEQYNLAISHMFGRSTHHGILNPKFYKTPGISYKHVTY